MVDDSEGNDLSESKDVDEMRLGVFECFVGASSREQEGQFGRGPRYCQSANDTV